MVAGCPVQTRSEGKRRNARFPSVPAQPISGRDRRAGGPAPSRGMTPEVHRFSSHHAVKRGPLTANIDVHIGYTLEPVERATCVIRDLDLTIQNTRPTEGGGALGRIRVP